MATDLTTLDFKNGGAIYAQTGISTTWLEIKIPAWAHLVTIQPTAQAIYFSYEGVDGAAPSAQVFPQAADSIIQYNPRQTTRERYIYIASQTGTATAYLIFE